MKRDLGNDMRGCTNAADADPIRIAAMLTVR
jgi:hypothetical protein